MNESREYIKATKLLEQVKKMLNMEKSDFRKSKSPMALLEKTERMVLTARNLYSNSNKDNLSYFEEIKLCNRLLREIGKYYSFLGSYYFEKANHYRLSGDVELSKQPLKVKVCLKKMERCFENHDRLCPREVNNKKTKAR